MNVIHTDAEPIYFDRSDLDALVVISNNRHHMIEFMVNIDAILNHLKCR